MFASAKDSLRVCATLAACLFFASGQAETTEVAEASGVRAYFGIVPAAMLDSTSLRHGGDFRAWGKDGPLPDAHHLLVALFDAATGERITEAVVELMDLAPAGGANPWKLDRFSVGDAIVYGGLVRLDGRRIHQFEIRVRRPGTTEPVIFHYTYDTSH